MTPIEGLLPKLMRRMPPQHQRRNRAYLNRQIHRDLALGRAIRDCLAATQTGLAIDLGGSLERRFRTDDVGAAYLDEPFTLIAPLSKGEVQPLFVLKSCAF